MLDSGNMPEPDSQETADLLHLGLPISQKVVLVIDLVESVRLMAADEAGVVARWHDFTQYARSRTIPAHQGRLVKSLGDGLMVEFEQPRQAVNAALALHLEIANRNPSLGSERQMHLRAGVNATHVYTDHNDIYGSGVNLAARIATLAGPGETVVTAQVRDGLTDGLDASIEDLGECYLKHIEQPVRAYRVGAAGAAPVVVARREYATPLQPTIAVIPFTSRSNQSEHFAVGELIADSVIGQLSRTAELKVISRMSATVFRNRTANLRELEDQLGCNYALSGSYLVIGSQGGGKLLITAELADSANQKIVWYDRFHAEIGDLLQIESECVDRLSQAVHLAILRQEAERAQLQPVPTLAAYSLKLSGIELMHRSQSVDFDKGHDVLLALSERHTRSADTKAWLAKWHVLRVLRGNSPAPAEDARLAMDACRSALEVDPGNSLALAVKGYTLCQMLGDADSAKVTLDQAIQNSPSEVHARLYRSTMSAIFGNTESSVEDALIAKSLSPFDPHAYFLETILASAYAANCEYGKAIDAANRSLRLYHDHAPTLRTLLLAQVEGGFHTDAQSTLLRLRTAMPGLSIARYNAIGSSNSSSRQRMVKVFRAMGIPET